jgi:NAD/NADP transhydrogenase beta subunit
MLLRQHLDSKDEENLLLEVGYITLIFFAIVLLITSLSGLKEQYTMKSLITVSIPGLLCALIGFYDISNVNNPMVKIGIGLYLIVGTGLGIIGAAFGLRASK